MSIEPWIASLGRSVVPFMPAFLARSLLFRHRFGYFPSIRAPQTFQEKINYRVLFDRRKLLVTASSKVESKNYVEGLRVPSLKIPTTYWHGTDLNELKDVSPPTEWVLKPSHRSGATFFGPAGYVHLDERTEEIKQCLKEREYRTNKLWAYRHVSRELILEERLGSTSNLTDYKFFVFDGRVALVQVDSSRFDDHVRALYDEDFCFIEASYGVSQGKDIAPRTLLQKLAKLASQVGHGFDFVRVDLYHHQDETYFGELTIYPGGGLSPWPYELDLAIGAYWKPFPPETRVS